MVDTPPLINIDLAGVWTLATRALDKANDVAVKQAVIDAKLDQHLAWCVQVREEDRRAREEDRRDAQQWREGLGKRLDLIGRYGISGLIGIIGLLLSIIGVLLKAKFGG